MLSEIKTRVLASRSDLKAFLSLPDRIYRNDPLWAPQIRLFERREFLRGTNPVLTRSPHSLFLAEDDEGSIRGRIIAYEDPRYNSHHGTRLGFFGSFEADGPEAALSLFTATQTWIAGRGLTGIIGPIDPVAECWGFVIEGFERQPVFMSPHNPPAYAEWIEASGFSKAKDLLVFEVDSRNDYILPERYLRFEEHFIERHPAFSARPLNRRDIDADIRRVVDITNAAVDGNWGFVPVSDEERDVLAGNLKPVIDSNAIWFIEDQGQPVACCLGFPDLNIPIRRFRGRVIPFGWLDLLRAKNTLVDYRLWSLAVLPEYHGIGLDALLYINLYRSLALRKRGIRMEANYVLEDNPRIIKALEKLGMTRMKTYRVFEKAL